MKKFFPYLLIAFACIAAYWQVVTFTDTLKYDILDGYLPGHFYISECLRNNIFPLWNPYQQLGFPIYADLLNTNYLIDMFIGRLFPYTNITFHVLLVLYLILAGIGAFKLSKHLGIGDKFNQLIAIAYPLSGFFTGNAQHIQFIIGAALLPFSLYYFLKLAYDLRLRNMLLFVLTTSLLISGGYPSLAILLAYLLVLMFLYNLVKFLRQKLYKHAGTYFAFCFGSGILLLILNSGLIIGVWQSTPYVARFAGLSYEYAITNPFTPESLISIIAPLVPAAFPLKFHTDLSMNNHYFGVIMVMFFIYGLFQRNNLKSLLILAAGVTTLVLSFGDHFFVHRIFYDFVPFFDKFRHPSAFRAFTILLFLLFAGIQVTRYDPSSPDYFKKFRKVYIGFILAILFTCLLSSWVVLKEISGPTDFRPEWKSLINDYGIFGPLFIQTVIILIINSIFIFLIIIRNKLAYFYQVTFILIVAEMIIFSQLNMEYSVTAKYNPLEIREFLRNRPYGFPLPDNHVLEDNTELSVSKIPVINNTNIYAKTVSPFYMYPFTLNGFRNLKNDSALFLNVIKNKLLYYGDTIIPLSQRKYALNKNVRYVFIEDSIYQNSFKNHNIGTTSGDTIECTYFSPSQFHFKTRSDSEQIVVFIQNNYPGWSVKIDGIKTTHYTVNRSLIGVVTPPGEHVLEYEFNNPLYKYATLISFGLLVVIMLLILLLKFIETKNLNSGQKFIYTGAIAVIFIGVILVLKPVTPFSRIQQSNYRIIGDFLQEIKSGNTTNDPIALFNTESTRPFDTLYEGQFKLYKRYRYQTEIRELWDMLDTLEGDSLIYVWSNVLEPPEVRGIIEMQFPSMVKKVEGERYAATLYVRDARQLTEAHKFLNDYEIIPDKWTREGVITDSTHSYSGQFSEKLSTEREFSSTFKYTIDKVPSGGIKIFSAVQFLNEGNNPFHLVITVNRKGKDPLYYAVDLTQFHTHKAGWNIGFASQQWLKSSLRKGDEILVYCWNSGRNEKLFIDDFCVKME